MHRQLASNTLWFHEGDVSGGNTGSGTVAIFPSSPESGLAVFQGGPVLLSTDDVAGLRDFLNLALEQAEGDSPFQVVNTRCPVCLDHPGWAHNDERSRNEPADVCKACLGSGTKQDVDAGRMLTLAQSYTLVAREALADEREGDFTTAVLRLANVAATLQNLVTTW
jgi:hypothetical protein